MRITLSIELIWQIAAQEAVVGEFNEIFPEHFFLALLKFAELPSEEITKFAQDPVEWDCLDFDIGSINVRLQKLNIESTPVRKKIRALLGNGGNQYKGGPLHRSNLSRKLFKDAANLAYEENYNSITPAHLLETIISSPSLIVKNAIGTSSIKSVGMLSLTPLLDKFGKNLIAMASSGEISGTAGRSAEQNLLIRLLSEKGHKSIFLIHESTKSFQDVINNLAIAIHKKEIPSSLNNKKLIDITVLKDHRNSQNNSGITSWQLAEEASRVNNIILIRGIADNQNDFLRFKLGLKNKSFQNIIAITPGEYQDFIQSDREWRDLAHFIWISDDKIGEIPDEL